MMYVIIFINVIIKNHYDGSYLIIKFLKGSQIYFRFHYKYLISGINPKLFSQKVDLFKIFEKIENLAYRLKLFNVI